MSIQLAKAISLALSGAALTIGANSALAGNTIYNTYAAETAPTPADVHAGGGTQLLGTDGWVYGKAVAPNGVANPGFVGIGGSSAVSASTPFAYTGGAIVNWATELTGANDSTVISQADAYSRYGVYANIDVAAGSWSDASRTGASGWKHNIDIGLFKSDVTTDVSLHATGITTDANGNIVNDLNNAFGFTIFQGMDTSTTAYGHHGSWNAGNNATGLTSSSLVPGTSFGIGDIVAYSVGGVNPQNISTIDFHAVAGQVYTIVMGGYQNGAWNKTVEGYSLSVTAVPVPGAVWLFASAVAGMAGLQRRRS